MSTPAEPDPQPVEDGRRLDQTDMDPTGVDAAVERLDQIDMDLTGVDAALRRLDEGTYGLCEVCGSSLSAETVEANPLATRCPDHSA